LEAPSRLPRTGGSVSHSLAKTFTALSPVLSCLVLVTHGSDIRPPFLSLAVRYQRIFRYLGCFCYEVDTTALDTISELPFDCAWVFCSCDVTFYGHFSVLLNTQLINPFDAFSSFLTLVSVVIGCFFLLLEVCHESHMDRLVSPSFVFATSPLCVSYSFFFVR